MYVCLEARTVSEGVGERRKALKTQWEWEQIGVRHVSSRATPESRLMGRATVVMHGFLTTSAGVTTHNSRGLYSKHWQGWCVPYNCITSELKCVICKREETGTWFKIFFFFFLQNVISINQLIRLLEFHRSGKKILKILFSFWVFFALTWKLKIFNLQWKKKTTQK